MNAVIKFSLLFVLLPFCSSIVAGQPLNNVFTAGEAGYTCFRIPAIITTQHGVVLAFAEARRLSCSDAGDIDLVVKRSIDGGQTWSGLNLVWSDSLNTCGNPTPVIDEKTGKLILLATWNYGPDHEKEIIAGTSKNTRRVFVLHSLDDGNTWSPAMDITESVKLPSWTWYATGPGKGIQIVKGRHAGRLVIPCNHMVSGSGKNYSHCIFSDDAGEHWKLGGVTAQDSVNESTVAEISRGRLLLNMRNASKKRWRQTAISKDGGKSWSNIHPDKALIEPVCEGNLLSYRFSGKRNLLLFSNPASTSTREKMTIRASTNNGKRWDSLLLYSGPSAYSSITVLPNGNIGCFYEAGLKKPYEGIVFQEVDPQSIKRR